MEAYVDEVRKLEERFDGLQMEHVPRAENDIADGLSKRAALKLPVEPGTFVLQLTQPSVTPSTGQSKKRKLTSGRYFPAELPEAAGKRLAGANVGPAEERPAPARPQALVVEANVPGEFVEEQHAPAKSLTHAVEAAEPGKLAGERQTPAERQALAAEPSVPAAEEMPLVLVVEPQAPAWAQ
jgi:hypothetical protein